MLPKVAEGALRYAILVAIAGLAVVIGEFSSLIEPNIQPSPYSYYALEELSEMRCEIIRAGLLHEAQTDRPASAVLVYPFTDMYANAEQNLYLPTNSSVESDYRYWPSWLFPCLEPVILDKPNWYWRTVEAEANTYWAMERLMEAEQPYRLQCLFLNQPEIDRERGIATLKVADYCLRPPDQAVETLTLVQTHGEWSVVARVRDHIINAYD